MINHNSYQISCQRLQDIEYTFSEHYKSWITKQIQKLFQQPQPTKSSYEDYMLPYHSNLYDTLGLVHTRAKTIKSYFSKNFCHYNVFDNNEGYNTSQIYGYTLQLYKLFNTICNEHSLNITIGTNNYTIKNIVGLETLGEHIHDTSVIGYRDEIQAGEEHLHHFNHHPIFIFKSDNNSLVKITYHSLLESEILLLEKE